MISGNSIRESSVEISFVALDVFNNTTNACKMLN